MLHLNLQVEEVLNKKSYPSIGKIIKYENNKQHFKFILKFPTIRFQILVIQSLAVKIKFFSNSFST